MKTILFLLMILPMSSILESPAAFAACDSYTYGATPYCACANVNGAAAAAAGAPATPDTGSVCYSGVGANAAQSTYNPPPNPIQATYNPNSWFDFNGHDQILNSAAEPIDGSGLVASLINFSGNPSYQRKIWTCSPPYRIVGTQCTFDPTYHACGVGGGGVPDSPVSATLKANGGIAKAQNPKLACCMNDYDPSNAAANISSTKYDCVESSKTYADFNALWTDSDASADGGQLFAMILYNAIGQPISGFYTQKGSRCGEYSEFAGSIQPGTVDPKVGAGTSYNSVGTAFVPVGTPIPVAGVAAYATMQTGVQSQTPAKTIPSSVTEMIRCPILVRAAFLPVCPIVSAAPVLSKTLEIKDASGNLIQRRCSSAGNIQIHIRIEQVYQISSEAKLQPFDTVMSQTRISSLSISQIIAQKYGSGCPPGSYRQGQVCVIQ